MPDLPIRPATRRPRLPAVIAAAPLVFILLALAGCGAPAVRPPAALPNQIALAPLPPVANAQAAWPQEQWWQAYGDPQLEELMARALDDNPTLALATARLAQAEAATGVSRAARTPQLAADLSASAGRQSARGFVPPPPIGPGGEYIRQGAANVNLAWDLDLAGRQAALIAAAGHEAAASAHDRAAARLTLTTALARSYAQLAAHYQLQDNAEATLKQRQAIVDLTRQRVAAGLDTAVETRQAETATASLQAELVQLASAIAVSKLQLAALAGAAPDLAGQIERPQWHDAPFNVPNTLPLDLLARRPEIAAQRARLLAAEAEVTAARADFFPNINLTALLGFQAIGLDHLFSSPALTNGIGPAVHLPLFDGGRRQAGHASRVAGVDAAVAQYRQSVLAAAQDVAEQLTRVAALEREARATGEALAAAGDAYRLALLRYREGLNSYLNVLAVEHQLLLQQRAMADLTARRRDLQITLLRALGGGYLATDSSQP